MHSSLRGDPESHPHSAVSRQGSTGVLLGIHATMKATGSQRSHYDVVALLRALRRHGSIPAAAIIGAFHRRSQIKELDTDALQRVLVRRSSSV